MKRACLQSVVRGSALALALAGTLGFAWAQPAPDGMVVLRIDAGRVARDQVELRIGKCLAAEFPPPPALGTESPAGALRAELFPWLEPGVLPAYADELAALFGTSRVAQKLEALGVRHVVSFTARALGKKEMGGVVGIPYMGFYGLGREDVVYELDFIVWDARKKRVLDAGHAEWKRAIGVLGIGLPIPFVYTTQAEACDVVIAAVRSAVATAR